MFVFSFTIPALMTGALAPNSLHVFVVNVATIQTSIGSVKCQNLSIVSRKRNCLHTEKQAHENDFVETQIPLRDVESDIRRHIADGTYTKMIVVSDKLYKSLHDRFNAGERLVCTGKRDGTNRAIRRVKNKLYELHGEKRLVKPYSWMPTDPTGKKKYHTLTQFGKHAG